jgi:hypothetical protein
MANRLALVLALLGACVVSGQSRAGVHAGVTPFGASGSTALRIDATRAYLISFTAVREVTSQTSSLRLISHVSICDIEALRCREVSEQTDVLPQSALSVARSGRSATLRTSWARTNLVIAWSASGAPVIDGNVTLVTSEDGRHHQAWIGHASTHRGTVAIRLLGRTCKDSALIYTSENGTAEDYLVSGPSGLPRAETLRSQLAATRGRCFNPQN